MLISLHLYVFSLRGIGMGTWPQSETAVAALHSLACLCGLGLIFLNFRKQLLIYVVRQPFVLLPFALGVWSLVTLPFHEFPLRDFLGSARTGEGIVWWFDLAVFTAAALLLWRISFWRKAMIVAALTGLASNYILVVSHNYTGHGLGPYFFSDYVAFPVIALIPVFYIWCTRCFQKPAAWILFYIILNALLFGTKNRALMGFGLAFPPAFFLLWSLNIRAALKERLGFIVTPLLPLFALGLLLGLALFPFAHGFYDVSESAWFFKNIASRAYLIQSGLEPLQTNVLYWITGTGWGIFEDHIIRFLPLNWLDITHESKLQWDGLTSDHFHSHNMFSETLSAVGILGCVLLYFYFCAFAIYTKSAMRLPALMTGAGFMVWASLWFFLPLHMPFLVFAGASIARGKYLKIRVHKYFISLALIFIIALQIAAAFLIYETSRNTHQYEPRNLRPTDIQAACPIEYNDYGAGGLHLARMILDRVRYTTYLPEEFKINYPGEQLPDDLRSRIDAHVRSLNHLLCQSQNYAQTHHAGERLRLTQILIRGEILLQLNDVLDQETKDYYYKGWAEDVKSWLASNPNRSDQAIPYLLWHVIHGQEAQSQEIVEMIYRRNPNDPVGAWFKGLYLLGQGGQSREGLALMRSAMQNGIERMMVIEPQIKEMLEK